MLTVFLQCFEYFEGSIFLTTNRIDCIDPAFESRIHVSFSYPDLTQELRRKVWKNFIQSLKVNTLEIRDADIDQFSTVDLNGRQIKNMVKMAGLLAAANNGQLRAEHVESMMRIVKSK